MNPSYKNLDKGPKMVERRYINAEELSDYLGVSKTTIYYWVSQKKIPYIKRARLRFDIREIDKWMAEKKVKELA